MSKTRIETVKLPAFLASALVNGDASGLDEDDDKWLAEALAYLGDGNVVDVGEPYFSWTCELPGWGRCGADMADYIVIYREG